MSALAVTVFCIGVAVDLAALVLWLVLRARRSTKIEDWPAPAPVPAAMLRAGQVREYGNAELARVVRAIQPLIDSGRQPWSLGSFSSASSAPCSCSAHSTPRRASRSLATAGHTYHAIGR